MLDIIKSIEEAQKAKLYADCQDCALVIGEFIEEIVGEGTQTVSLLEEYCEVVYKASIGEAGDGALKKSLIKVENSIKNELKPNRIEIAFLSYKASMSDSIESVYMAAKNDPSCDAFWIPIPYYDRKPDGSFDVMRLDGPDCYKDHIVCTDWQDYNIEERKPDVIFTFAPYDGFGGMTSVHPDYYCERLRELTDLFVYIPYFVTKETVKKPFIRCAGVVYSHLTMLQSDIIKKRYLEEYKQFIKDDRPIGDYGRPEDKLVALGSPKFDAIINAKREEFTLPQEWQRLLDGKKAVFFNTSIGAILNGGKQYLKKIRHVHETFRKSDDTVLWWRPHPLSNVAYSAMCTDEVQEYMEIVEEYKKAGFGIYDDSPDLHRAISWTDAYYGDASSVPLLFQIIGKPVLYSEVSATEDIPRFRPTRIYKSTDELWFSLRNSNALINMSDDNCVPHLSDRLIDELNTIIVSNNTAENDKIVLRNGTLKDFTKKLDNRNADAYYLTILYNGHLMMFPFHYGNVLKIDTTTDEISIAEEFRSPEPESKLELFCPYFTTINLFGDNLFAYNQLYTTLYKYNIKTSELVSEKIIYSKDTSNKLEDIILEDIMNNPDKIAAEKDCFYFEQNSFTLHNLLRLISDKNTKAAGALVNRRREVAQVINAAPDGDAGVKILEYIKKRSL